jgi:hypothetical protein
MLVAAKQLGRETASLELGRHKGWDSVHDACAFLCSKSKPAFTWDVNAGTKYQVQQQAVNGSQLPEKHVE